MRCFLAPFVLVMLAAATPAPAAAEDVIVFDDLPVNYNRDAPSVTSLTDDVRAMMNGRTLETTIDLPPAPSNQRDARRIVAEIDIAPELLTAPNQQVRPGDPWTRLGTLSVADPDSGDDATFVEVVRFVTGFGGPSHFEQDLTPLAPHLYGRKTLRLTISTFMNPGWRVSVRLRYSDQGIGYRRPVLARSVFQDPRVTSESSKLSASIEIPEGVMQPRLRVVSTGHSSDGRYGNEFISCTHVLKIDDVVVAMWRPWREDGGVFRDRSPTSARWPLDGRALWSSDLDRSGWVPGAVVEPTIIPLPELSAATHTIELEILGIRAKQHEDDGMGYWRVSAIVVADEPWPVENAGDD